PVAHDPMSWAIDVQALAALVADLADCLEKQQAAIGIKSAETPATGIAEKPFVVGGRFGAKQRQAEAILPLDSAVTDARVAAEAAEKRNHMPAEQRLVGHGISSAQRRHGDKHQQQCSIQTIEARHQCSSRLCPGEAILRKEPYWSSRLTVTHAGASRPQG